MLLRWAHRDLLSWSRGLASHRRDRRLSIGGAPAPSQFRTDCGRFCSVRDVCRAKNADRGHRLSPLANAAPEFVAQSRRSARAFAVEDRSPFWRDRPAHGGVPREASARAKRRRIAHETRISPERLRGIARVRAAGASRALAPQLVREPTTSAWTMFALALSIAQELDSTLAYAIAAHPNARDNPATLTILGELVPGLRARAVGSVRNASQRVRDRLETCFVNAPAARGQACGRDVLLDSDIRNNADALRLLANLTRSGDPYVGIEAERLLHDSDFLRWGPRYTPVP